MYVYYSVYTSFIEIWSKYDLQSFLQ